MQVAIPASFTQKIFYMESEVLIVQAEPMGACQLIEIPITAGKQNVPFPDVPELRNQSDQVVIIKALRLITPDVMPIAPIQGGANAPLTELQKMVIVLYSEQWEKGEYIPILKFNDTFTEGSGTPVRFHTTKLDNWKSVDWPKCKIIYANGTQSVGSYTVVMEVEYVRIDPKTKTEIQGIRRDA